MARTQKNTVNYFPHDCNASVGDTLTVLQSRFGNDGYAFWFKLLEKLAGTEGHYLDCQNSNRWQLLLAKTGVNEITGVEIMKLLVEMEAIDRQLWENRVIWCQHLVDNVADVYRNRRREVPSKPISTDNNGITTGENSISTPDNAQSKVKESKANNKEKDIKRKYGEFWNVLLSDREIQKLIDTFGEENTKQRIEQLSQGKEAKGYKYKSDYAAILNWSRRDNEKTDKRGLPKTYTPTPDYADL